MVNLDRDTLSPKGIAPKYTLPNANANGKMHQQSVMAWPIKSLQGDVMWQFMQVTFLKYFQSRLTKKIGGKWNSVVVAVC